MKKILVLGTGNAQVDFIKYCKSYGLEVFACSYKNEGRGIEEADHFDIIDIVDSEKIKGFVQSNNIDFIYTVGNDIAMPTIAKVSTELGLRTFVSFDTAKTCINKLKLRSSLRELENGKFSIDYDILNRKNGLKSWEKFPAIVKPAKSQGQRGIKRVTNIEELKGAYSTAIDISNDGRAIVEEYVDGFEISLNSYLHKGEPLFYFVTERESFSDYPGGIIKSHKYPVKQPLDESKLQTLVHQTCQHLNIQEGPVYFQIKVNTHGQPKIIEVTPRFDGCHLWRLFEIVCGKNLFEVLLNHLHTGKVLKTEFDGVEMKTENSYRLEFFTSPPDISMDKSKFDIRNNYKYLEWYYENGEPIRKINGYQEKVGYIIY